MSEILNVLVIGCKDEPETCEFLKRELAVEWPIKWRHDEWIINPYLAQAIKDGEDAEDTAELIAREYGENDGKVVSLCNLELADDNLAAYKVVNAIDELQGNMAMSDLLMFCIQKGFENGVKYGRTR